MKYKVLNNFVYGNKVEAKKDSVIEISSEDAAPILKAGLIEPVLKESAKVEEPKVEAEEQKPVTKPEPKKGKK